MHLGFQKPYLHGEDAHIKGAPARKLLFKFTLRDEAIIRVSGM